MAHETSGTPDELVLPDNIQDLLAGSLKPADHLVFMHGGNTLMFLIESHPDLFVRLNFENHLEDMEASLNAVHGLREYGVNVPPARAVEHDGEHHTDVYVVTKRIDGRPLVELLAGNADEELLAEVDTTWAGLARNLINSKKERAIPMDVATPEQYMFGVMAGETQPRTWLVDLPEHTEDLNGDDPDAYIEQVLNVANGVAIIQALTGKVMAAAQSALEKAVMLAEDSEEYGDGMANAVKYVIENNVTLYLDGDEDRIVELRTK